MEPVTIWAAFFLASVLATAFVLYWNGEFKDFKNR